MAFDLVSELRQLAHDLVSISPQASAIKAKHPAILDAAAREIQQLRSMIYEQNELLKAVTCDEFRGVECSDIAGRNWFDIRDSCLIRCNGGNT